MTGAASGEGRKEKVTEKRAFARGRAEEKVGLSGSEEKREAGSEIRRRRAKRKGLAQRIVKIKRRVK